MTCLEVQDLLRRQHLHFIRIREIRQVDWEQQLASIDGWYPTQYLRLERRHVKPGCVNVTLASLLSFTGCAHYEWSYITVQYTSVGHQIIVLLIIQLDSHYDHFFDGVYCVDDVAVLHADDAEVGHELTIVEVSALIESGHTLGVLFVKNQTTRACIV